MGHVAKSPHVTRSCPTPAHLSPELERRLARTSTVLLDFDGTVVNTVELITDSFRYTIKRVLARDLPDDVLIQNLGMPLAEQMRIFSPEKESELVRVYRKHNRAHHDDMIRKFPGAKAALERLRDAGFRLGVVTSKGEELTRRGMDLFDLGRLFDATVFMEDTEVHKPNPEPVLEALRRLDATPDTAVFVGDSPHDIVAGNRAGVVTIAALWGPFPRERVVAAAPDICLESVDELAPLLISARGA